MINAKENVFTGKENSDTFIISGKSIINGKVDLGKGDDIFNLSEDVTLNKNISLDEGNDNLSLDNTVQINGILNGGNDIDILAFTLNSVKNTTDSLNILYDIKGFEKTNIATDITLFEKTVDDNGDLKTLNVELGNIQ